MIKTRFSTILLILILWLSTTGFHKPPENVVTFPLSDEPSVGSPSVLAAVTFGKSLPDDRATDVSATALQLSWTAATGYTGTGTITYRYCITTKAKCPASKWIRNGSSTSVTVSNLLPGTKYNWWVRAYVGKTIIATADSGASWSFTTMALPQPFSKISPANMSTGLDNASLTLSWAGSTGATSYEYCYNTGGNTCARGWTSVGSATSVTLTGLSSNAIYYWQVQAKNAGGTVLANSGTWWQFTTKIVAGVFNKLSPANLATEQPVTGLVLSWTIADDATRYDYCVSENNTQANKDCDTGWQYVGISTSATPSGLLNSKTYYWKVRKTDATGFNYADSTNVLWSFTTQGPPPVAFNKLSPTDGALYQYTDTLLTWQSSANAAYYEYCVNVSAGTVCEGPWTRVDVPATSVIVEALDPDTPYYWQVRAVNTTSTVEANTGTWWTFRTQVNPPADFTKSAPATGSTRMSTTPTLSWNTSTGTGITYQVCIDKIDDGLCQNDSWSAAQPGTTYTVPVALDNGTQYFWQVRASNATGTTYADGDMIAWWSFTTLLAPPTTFYKSGPGDGALNQPLNLSISWTASDTGVTYEYCVSGTGTSCPASPGWISTSNTTAALTNLSRATTYHWQVRARNSENTYTDANGGTWWSFITIPNPPAAFTKNGPSDGATVVATNPALSWTPSTTPGASYAICYDTVDDDACANDAWQPIASGSSYGLSGLPYNTTYYWQVRATNAGGDTDANGAAGWWSFTTMLPAPTAFGKSAPLDGAGIQPTNLSLSWGASDAGVRYEVCYDTSNDDACNAWQPVTAGTTYDLSGLNNATTYYWQVRALNSEDTVTEANGNTWWRFTTMAPAPTTFNKSSPVSGSGDRPLDLSLSWAASDPGVSYEYCVSATDGACGSEQDWISTTNTYASPLGLSRATTYYWQVRARNSENTATEADTGTWWSFTTIPFPPAGFAKSLPIDGASRTAINLTLSWTPSETQGADYQVCYDTTDDDTCAGDAWQDASGAAFPLTGLDYAATYYWQVRASNPGGDTYADGAWWSFTTMLPPPSAFGKSTPQDGADIQPVNLSLTWSPVDTGVDYEVCYDTSDDDTCAGDAWQSVSSGASFDPAGLEYATTYSWQVRAINSEDTITEANAGVWWSFTTMDRPPSAFAKASPENGAPSQPPDTTLEWSASDSGVTYAYCVSLSDGSCPSEQDWVAAAGTSAAPTGLSYETTYYWQVRAINSQGTVTEANSGTWWRFTTYSQPPANFVKTSPANQAPNQRLTLTLSWSSAGSGFTYEYCYTPATPFDCTGIWHTATATSAQISGLLNSTIYSWQVRAKDSSGHTTDANLQDTNPVWQFTTRPVPPSSSDVTYNNIPEEQTVADDLPGINQMTFALTGTQPAGNLILTPAGHFTYQPPHDFFGQVQFQFTVTDGINDPSAPYTVTINYLNVNDPPVLDPIADITVVTGQVAAFTPSARDVDLPAGSHLTYSLDLIPTGASFNPDTGAFQWTPLWVPGQPNVYILTLTVSDSEPTNTPVQRTIKITVLPGRIYLPVIFH